MFQTSLALYLARCDPTDPQQIFHGKTFVQPFTSSSIINTATNSCVVASQEDPVLVQSCTSPAGIATEWLYNATNQTLSLTKVPSDSGCTHCHVGACLDAHAGNGPEMDLWTCHPKSNADYTHQRLFYNTSTSQLSTIPGDGCNPQCITVIPPNEGPHSGDNECSSTGATTFLPNTNAKCLDGSDYGFNYVSSTSNVSTKWTIFMEGGGWCNTEEECIARANTTLGSSKDWPKARGCSCKNIQLNGDGNVLDPNCHCLYLPYCDGASFSGYRKEPWGKNTTGTSTGTGSNSLLTFRGIKNLDHAVDYAIQHLGMQQATEIVVTGGSAGGLAVFLHADRISKRVQTQINRTIVVRAQPDVGFFLDHLPAFDPPNTRTFEDDMLNIVTMQNCTFGVDGGLNSKCRDRLVAHGQDPRLCFMAPHVAPSVTTPMFLTNSRFDAFQLSTILKVWPGLSPYNFSNQKGRTAVLEYGDAFVKSLRKNVLDGKPLNGAFITTCICHGCPWENLHVNGTYTWKAYNDWFKGLTLGEESVWIDERGPNGGGEVGFGGEHCALF